MARYNGTAEDAARNAGAAPSLPTAEPKSE
jgi:hypothetical protein